MNSPNKKSRKQSLRPKSAAKTQSRKASRPARRERVPRNPPVIIDGGSITVLTAARFNQTDTNVPNPQPGLPWRHTQKPLSSGDYLLGAIKKVRLFNDIGDPVLMGVGDPASSGNFDVNGKLEVRIWFQKKESEDLGGAAEFSKEMTAEPNFLLTNEGPNNSFDVRFGEKIDNPDSDNHYKANRRVWRYEESEFEGENFRIGKVEIRIGAASYMTPDDEAVINAGFRIILIDAV